MARNLLKKLRCFCSRNTYCRRFIRAPSGSIEILRFGSRLFFQASPGLELPPPKRSPLRLANQWLGGLLWWQAQTNQRRPQNLERWKVIEATEPRGARSPRYILGAPAPSSMLLFSLFHFILKPNPHIQTLVSPQSHLQEDPCQVS